MRPTEPEFEVDQYRRAQVVIGTVAATACYRWAKIEYEDPDEPTPDRFLRGDCNDDGAVDISDAVCICILNWLFFGGATPGCVAALNTNGDEEVDIADPVYSLWFSFLGGPAPVEPYIRLWPGNISDG